MAVVTPDGIVGKVVAAYPTASQVLLVTDPDFAAGVISQKNQVHGTLKGQGTPQCKVDYVQNEEKVEVGEWFFTSGDDRMFPEGLPGGHVTRVRDGQPFKEILVEPSGLQHGLEEVLIVIEGVHQADPGCAARQCSRVHLQPPPAGASASPTKPPAPQPGSGTDADRLRDAVQGRSAKRRSTCSDEGRPGAKPPDFNRELHRRNGRLPSRPPAGHRLGRGANQPPPPAEASPPPEPPR